MIFITTRLRRIRELDAGGERGLALIAAVFFMVLVAGLSLVVLGVLLAQSSQGFVEAKNTKTVYAAQAGLQAALGIIRSAALPADGAGDVFGDTSKLPCTLTGKVDGETEGTGYSVTISYFITDPLGSTPQWQAANKLPCGPGTPPVYPRYALIKSGGLGAAVPGNSDPAYGDRYLSAIYKFRVSNINVAGGPIYNNDGKFCLSATTATVGSLIKFVKASSCTNNDLQLWIYDTDYQIKLASTAVVGAPGLCITGPVNDGEATQNAKLATCLTTVVRWNQLWSWTGSYSWTGQKKNIAGGFSNYCLSPDADNGADLTGKYLKVRTGCKGQFAPSAQVGAGPAGYATHQIVNYKEFGRCADLTNENLNSTFMISYPCKQDPTGTGANLHWNHKWYYTEPLPGVPTAPDQEIYVNYHNDVNQRYCLNAPTYASGSKDVWFSSCNGGEQQKWTRVYETGDYASSYLFVDYLGRCLATDPTQIFSGDISRIDVLGCNGSLAQKWNAPPTYVDSTFGGYREIAG